MCDPVSMATTALVTTAVSTTAGSVAAYQQQAAANKAAKYQAKVAGENASAAEAAAEQAAWRGLLELSKHYDEVSQLSGQQRAAYAGSGVRVGMGTPGAVEEQTAIMGEQDAMMIRYNTALEVWGREREAWDWRTKQKLLRRSTSSPFLAAAGPLLSGTASFAGMYAGFSKEGLLGGGGGKVPGQISVTPSISVGAGA